MTVAVIANSPLCQMTHMPNTLSARLRKLEEGGVLERRKYSQNPPRWEYHLTKSGDALAPMMAALRSWGSAHTRDLPGEGD